MGRVGKEMGIKLAEEHRLNLPAMLIEFAGQEGCVLSGALSAAEQAFAQATLHSDAKRRPCVSELLQQQELLRTAAQTYHTLYSGNADICRMVLQQHQQEAAAHLQRFQLLQQQKLLLQQQPPRIWQQQQQQQVQDQQQLQASTMQGQQQQHPGLSWPLQQQQKRLMTQALVPLELPAPAVGAQGPSSSASCGTSLPQALQGAQEGLPLPAGLQASPLQPLCTGTPSMSLGQQPAALARQEQPVYHSQQQQQQEVPPVMISWQQLQQQQQPQTAPTSHGQQQQAALAEMQQQQQQQQGADSQQIPSAAGPWQQQQQQESNWPLQQQQERLLTTTVQLPAPTVESHGPSSSASCGTILPQALQAVPQLAAQDASCALLHGASQQQQQQQQQGAANEDESFDILLKAIPL